VAAAADQGQQGEQHSVCCGHSSSLRELTHCKPLDSSSSTPCIGTAVLLGPKLRTTSIVSMVQSIPAALQLHLPHCDSLGAPAVLLPQAPSTASHTDLAACRIQQLLRM
jgi:hypothetical protein